MLRRCILVIASLAVVLSTGCGGDSNPQQPERPKPGVNLVSGGSVTDTIGAPLPQPLVVRIIGQDGKPAPGAVVTFSSLTLYPSGPPGLVTAYLAGPGDVGLRGLMTDTTDADGVASVRVILGRTAGPAGVVVYLHGATTLDTIPYAVKPGAATRVIVEPADTSIFVGGSAALRATVIDRLGNERQDPVTFSLVSGPVQLDAGSRLATATGIGRAQIRAEAAGRSTTAFISAVPQGVIAAYNSHTSSLVTVRLDGTGMRQVVREIVSTPAWAPNGESIVYGRGGRLYTVDAATLVSRLLISPDTSLTGHEWPAFSRDGRWIYFESGVSLNRIWRVRSDGTDLRRITPSTTTTHEVFPSEAPDGRLTFTGSSGGVSTIRFRDLATGVASEGIATGGRNGVWSPAGDLIAFQGLGEFSTLHVMGPTGTNQRPVGPANRLYATGISWSPDGRWLLARAGSTSVLELIEVATGTALPLGWSAGLLQPAWKP